MATPDKVYGLPSKPPVPPEAAATAPAAAMPVGNKLLKVKSEGQEWQTVTSQPPLSTVYNVTNDSLNLFASKPYIFHYELKQDTGVYWWTSQYQQNTMVNEKDVFIKNIGDREFTSFGEEGRDFIKESVPKFFYLPINPSNLSISTSFANNLSPTLYGSAEERSPVRYYKIDIAGTTGATAKWIFNDEKGMSEYSGGRTSYSPNPLSRGLGIINSVTGGLGDRFLGGAVSSLNELGKSIAGNTPPAGMSQETSGYQAFHDFYRFLVRYQREASAGLVEGPLWFQNLKDCNQYKVSLQTFNLVRDASQPMLYNYSISMIGYAMTTLDAQKVGGSYNDVYQMRRNLGLDGVESSGLFGKIKNTVGAAAGFLGNVKGLKL